MCRISILLRSSEDQSPSRLVPRTKMNTFCSSSSTSSSSATTPPSYDSNMFYKLHRRMTRIQWISVVVVILSLLCRSVLPSTLTIAALADIFVTAWSSLASVSRAKAVTPVVSVDFTETGQIWKDPPSSEEAFGNSTKIMWGYWNSYPDNFPYLCQKALESWRVRNPDWRIIMLNDENFQDYVSVSDLPSTFYSLKVQHRSDILRLAVLIRYGGLYMDASTLVYKGFDHIWNSTENDQLLLTSLNQLPSAGLDMYNNGLLMTKGRNNPFLVEWRRRILAYSEAPALSQDDMKAHPNFARVHQHWDDPTLGVLGAMVPYHSNLWILNDMIWHNEKNLSKHIVHLPKIRWGFYYHSLPHFFDKLHKSGILDSHNVDANKLAQLRALAQDESDNPGFVQWSVMSLFTSIVKHLREGFFDHPQMTRGVLESVNVLKFTSHDMPLVDVGIRRIGLGTSTVGRIVEAAYELDEFPLQQATMGGALPAVLAAQEEVQ